MEGTAVVGGFRPLAVDEERLAGMAERDLLDVLERFDRRVVTGTPPGPGTQQRGEGGDVGMQVWHVRQGTATVV